MTKSLSKKSTVFETEIKAIESVLEWVMKKLLKVTKPEIRFSYAVTQTQPSSPLNNSPN